MKTLSLCACLLAAAAPAFAGFQPSLLGHMNELRADILRVQGAPAPAAPSAPSAPNPAAQAKVWAAEEALVAVRLELENQFLAFSQALSADDAFFASVPPQTRDAYKALVDKGAAAQKKLVDLGVLRAGSGDAARYAFAMRGKAPSAEAVKAFNDFVEAMAAFDDSVDADYMLGTLMKRFKAQPDSMPPAIKSAMESYFGFTQKMPAYTIRAMMALGEGIAKNGGQFNSRWGLGEDGAAAAPGRKS